jgi:hypothetical protein
MFSAATKTGSQPSAAANFVEDVFSTYLYTGTGATLAINNGIDLASKGGLVWCKGRNEAFFHSLVDSTRGISKWLGSNTGSAQDTFTDAITSFNNNGFTLGADTQGGYVNASTYNFVSWTFRDQPKFFDVVTYTGNSATQNISHNLGSVPGMIIVKRTDSTGDWFVYHRSLGNTGYMRLNFTQASLTSSTLWNSTTPTSSVFSLGATALNISGATYVAYLFAHDAGGFGTAGTDNVISCGSFVDNAPVTLGYEPQYLMVKKSSGADDWYIHDTMRGWPVSGDARVLLPNSSAAESGTAQLFPNATGFTASIGSGTYIYMAIRRGPMKVPTTGTSVFSPIVRNGNSVSPTVVTTPNFAVDMQISTDRTKTVSGWNWAVDKLRGNTVYLPTNQPQTEFTYTDAVIAFTNLGFNLGDGALSNTAGGSYVYWNFGRAPGFFDEVCYRGTGATGNAIAHNLTVAPELIIVKGRSGLVGANNWQVLNSFTSTTYQKAFLNLTDANTSFAYTDNGGLAAQPTATTFTVDNVANYNNASTNYVAYLFATCAGVSKVGSYTGNGTTQAIACGFTGGARFVLIKRTDSTGDWYVYDTARGMTVLTDPYLLLNSSAAESATLGSVTTTTGGFTVDASILAAINTNAASYIFLAIA